MRIILPEVENRARALLVHKHVLPVAHTKPVQPALNGLQPTGYPGTSRGVPQTLVYGKMCVPHAITAKMSRLEDKLSLDVSAKVA